MKTFINHILILCYKAIVPTIVFLLGFALFLIPSYEPLQLFVVLLAYGIGIINSQLNIAILESVSPAPVVVSVPPEQSEAIINALKESHREPIINSN